MRSSTMLLALMGLLAVSGLVSGTHAAKAGMNATRPEGSFHVCGNYCGPGWCDGTWLEEANCDDSVAPETHADTGASCADVCCRDHDKCCGHGDRSTCNRMIVECLSACDKMSLTCTLDGVPVPAGGIEAAMDIVEDWCCGSPCS
mmetsp:Transcript_80039/g.222658  ORF Transcript_80039/g.222658 Transcript_80039/m.222658 type:complete len:145 (+) Transcript_80039:73-507(+)